MYASVVEALITAHASLSAALGSSNPVTIRVGKMAVRQMRANHQQEMAGLLDTLCLPRPSPKLPKKYLCFLNNPAYKNEVKRMPRDNKIACIRQVRTDYENRYKKNLGLLQAKSYVEKLWGQSYNPIIDEFLKSEEIPF